MKYLILVFSFFLCVACSQKSIVTTDSQVNAQNNFINQTAKVIEEKPLEKLKPPSKKIKLPNVIDFGVFDVTRNSSQKDENGWNSPPFENAQIEISLIQEPKIGEKITIIPLKVNLEPFQLSITQVSEKKEAHCTGDKKEYYWDVELEKLTNKEILEINPVEYNPQELPFEVFGIYPPVEFAKNISQSELTSDMLPKGVSIKTVEGAIDLDNDGKPDLLEIKFCCSDASMSTKEDGDCYICQKSFKKVNGDWKLVDYAQPC